MDRRPRLDSGLAALLLVATPVVLSVAGGPPWALGSTSTTLALVIAVTWLLWAWCAVGLGIEVVRRILRHDLSTSQEDGAMSRVAARIAAIVLSLAATLGPAGMGAASAATPSAPRPTQSAPAPPPNPAPAAEPLTAPEAPGTWLVAEGDSLWSIAEALTGDGEAWVLISRANLGRIMGDGSVFTDPSLIYPGWSLEVPRELVSGPSPATADAASAVPATAGQTADAAAASPPAELRSIMAEVAPISVEQASSRPFEPAVAASSALGVGSVLAGLLWRRRRRIGPAPEADEELGDADVLLAQLEEPPTLTLTEAAALLAARDGRLDEVSLLAVGPHGATLSVRGRRRWQAEPVDLLDADIVATASPGSIVPLGDHEGCSLSLVVPPGCEARIAGPRASELAELARAASRELAWASLEVDDAERIVVDDSDPDLVAEESRLIVTGGPELIGDPAPPIAGDLVEGQAARTLEPLEPTEPAGSGATVRILRALPDIEGLAEALDSKRARRATEVVAYLALHHPEPVTGDRLRSRVLGSASADAASKTLFNVTSAARRALGSGPDGLPVLPTADRHGCYRSGDLIRTDVGVMAWHLAEAASADGEDGRLAHLRAAMEQIDGEPLGAVLAGWEWFTSEGHRARLDAAVELAAAELVDLALAHGLVELAKDALRRAVFVVPYSEGLAARAMEVAAAEGDLAGLRRGFDALGSLIDELDPGSWPDPGHEARYAELLEELRQRPAQASLAAMDAAPLSTSPSAPAAL